MIILEDKCTGCNLCIPYCPASAIIDNPVKSTVDIIDDECTECGVCYKSEICPVDAIYPQDLEWPRTLRAEFSDPTAPYVSPIFQERYRRGPFGGEAIDRRALLDRKGAEIRITGRGTAEMKTNDVTGRYKRGYCGIGIEVGRGGGGTRFREVEKLTRALAEIGVQLEEANPTYSLLADPETGAILPEILNEKVLSCILEFSISQERLPVALQCIKEVSPKVDSVFTVDLISVVGKDGSEPTIETVRPMGIPVSINGKVNVGLGRPLADIDS